MAGAHSTCVSTPSGFECHEGWGVSSPSSTTTTMLSCNQRISVPGRQGSPPEKFPDEHIVLADDPSMPIGAIDDDLLFDLCSPSKIEDVIIVNEDLEGI